MLTITLRCPLPQDRTKRSEQTGKPYCAAEVWTWAARAPRCGRGLLGLRALTSIVARPICHGLLAIQIPSKEANQRRRLSLEDTETDHIHVTCHAASCIRGTTLKAVQRYKFQTRATFKGIYKKVKESPPLGWNCDGEIRIKVAEVTKQMRFQKKMRASQPKKPPG